MESFLENRRITELAPSYAQPIASAVQSFHEQETAWAAWPEVRDGELWASALALPFLVERMSDRTDAWSRRWFEKRAEAHLQGLLGECATAREQRALSVALSNLKDFSGA